MQPRSIRGAVCYHSGIRMIFRLPRRILP